jgi:hypothetical protein
MIQRLILALALAFGLVTSVHADTFVTGTETVNQSAFGGNPSYNMVNRITGTSLGGYEFANDITHTTPTVGDLVNIVVVDKITGYIQTGGTNQNPGFGANNVLMVSALQAQITSTGLGVINTKFLSSSIGFYLNTGGYNPQNPSTWGASIAGVFQTPTAITSLVNPPTNVVPGPNGQGDLFLASQINGSTVNTGANQQSESRILYGPLICGTPAFVVPDFVPGQSAFGQFVQTVEQLNSGTLPDLTTGTQQADLNAIFTGLDPTAGSPFATFGSGTATDFTPDPLVATGDGEFTFGLNVDPGNVFPLAPPIPEPASMLLWGLVAAGSGLAGSVRRWRMKRRQA